MDSYFDKAERLESLKNKLNDMGFFTSAKEEETTIVEAIDTLMEIESNELPNEVALKIGELEEELKIVRKSLSSCEVGTETLASELYTYTEKSENKRLLENRKIGIVGGHKTDIQKIKDKFKEVSSGAKIKHPQTDGEKNSGCPPYSVFKEKYQHVDVLIVITGYAGHDLTGLADKLEDEQNVYTIRIEKPNNLNAIVQRVITSLKQRKLFEV
ncbi:hypothetical protein [Thalassomonas sp. M1454]|uniref:hypothetical protein n=1 Tax=Thalassomonas sp. M1454 TaxID=2594477 RepID=UPI001180F827|nr:hypothetical protein [Thalassomonas sp. M1454]TRX57170.1 hypothetical protein FNN08_06640 [Thalassomonas sp. M1454]